MEVKSIENKKYRPEAIKGNKELLKKYWDFPFYLLPFYGAVKELYSKSSKYRKINWWKAGGWFAYSLPGAIIKGPILFAALIQLNSNPDELPEGFEKKPKTIEQKVDSIASSPVDKNYFYAIPGANRNIYKE